MLRAGSIHPKDAQLSDLLLIDNVMPGGGSGVLARNELVRSVGGFDVSLSAIAAGICNRLSHCSEVASGDRTHGGTITLSSSLDDPRLRSSRARCVPDTSKNCTIQATYQANGSG